MATRTEIDQALGVLEREGWKAPKTIGLILAAHHAANDLMPAKTAVIARLSDAIREGEAEAAARAAVELAALPSEDYMPLSVTGRVTAMTTSALWDAIPRVEAYEYLRARFTATADELAEAMKIVDPDLPAEEAAELPPKPKGSAWASVPRLAADLDRLKTGMVFVLRHLLDMDVRTRRPWDSPDDALELCVVYDAKLAPQLKKIWERTDTPDSIYETARKAHVGRGGLWQDILKAGGKLEPATADAFTRWPDPGVVVTEPQPGIYIGHAISPQHTANLTAAHAAVAARTALEAATEPVVEEPVAPVVPEPGRPRLSAAPGALRHAAGLE
jgi:hypothetical protein